MQELLSASIGGGINNHNPVTQGNHGRLRKGGEKKSSSTGGAKFDLLLDKQR